MASKLLPQAIQYPNSLQKQLHLILAPCIRHPRTFQKPNQRRARNVHIDHFHRLHSHIRQKMLQQQCAGALAAISGGHCYLWNVSRGWLHDPVPHQLPVAVCTDYLDGINAP